MAAPQLSNLIAAPESQILANVRAILRGDGGAIAADPFLNAPGVYRGRPVTLWLLDGDRDMEFEPADDQLPLVKMTWGSYRSRMWTEAKHRGFFVLNFDCYVPGLCPEDAWALNHTLIKAFLPDDPPRRAAVKALLTDTAYAGAQLVGGQFTSSGSEKVKLGQSFYATKTRVVLTLYVHRKT